MTSNEHASDEASDDGWESGGWESENAPHQWMVRGDKAEAAGGDLRAEAANSAPSQPGDAGSAHLMDPLLGKVVARVAGELPCELVRCASRGVVRLRPSTAKNRKESERNPTPAKRRAWTNANRSRAAKVALITHGILYKLTSPSGKSYVGISKHSIERRILWHKSDHSCCHAIKAALKKYGFKNFKKEVLMSNVPLEDLPALEQAAIEEHATMAPAGYNLTRGGEHNPMDEPEARKKISDRKTKWWAEQPASSKQATVDRLQDPEVRARATATNRERCWQRELAKTEGMSAEAAEAHMQAYAAKRDRRAAEYLASKARKARM